MRRGLFAAVLAITACQRSGGDEPAPAPGSAAPRASTPRAALPPLPDPLPGTRRDVTAIVGSATRAAFGGGGDELVLASPDLLRVVDIASGRELGRAPAPGGCNVLVVRGETVIAGWGQSREHRDAPARVASYRLENKPTLVEETILAPQTSRAEIVAILPVQDGLFVAYFDSKYTVKSVIATKAATGWTTRDVATIRMATSYARTDDGRIVVGRVYGDAKGQDGDAFVLAADGTRTALPTLRGVRSVAAAGGDIFLGDGWHQNYGDFAHGRLVRVHAGTAELIEDTPGQFSIERILPTMIDGQLVLVTLGSHYVRAFARRGERWKGLTIAGAARDIAVYGNDVLVVADKSELVGLAGVTW